MPRGMINPSISAEEGLMLDTIVSEEVQNSQSLYSFTFNALFIIHEYIYSHSTTKFLFKKYIYSHLTTYFLFTKIFTHIYGFIYSHSTVYIRSHQGGAEDSYSAWHFFCVRIIQQKVTSHPVRQQATSLPGAKAKIYGNRFFYSVSKMMIFCNRLHILSLFFVHPVKELSLFTSMDYSTV